MKLNHNLSRFRGQAGITLIECIAYIAVFLILSGVATASFYLCWDHSKALISAADDIGAALRTGERWRADVRAASGTILVQTNVSGEFFTIPESQKNVIYRFTSHEVQRQAGAQGPAVVLLHTVVSSEMEVDARDGVTAWKWDLEMAQRRKETHLRLLFTFEAVQKLR